MKKSDLTRPQDLSQAGTAAPEQVAFVPTRDAGLARLEQFAARTGSHYGSQRNYDLGPSHRSTVSALSPWIRHRLVAEEEVLLAALSHHSPAASMKFVQEVFWRGYFKGWLEQHPSVWRAYEQGVQAALRAMKRNSAQKTDYMSAAEGRTGIACFDHWCRELKETGYLHNHARMWFASIWIFTLGLPWELGAQFFLDHLLDGDPASNTLSWRWVGGLHTKGKTYLARPENIAKYTNGAFNPTGQLALSAPPLVEQDDHPFVPLARPKTPVRNDSLLLVTSEDCNPEGFVLGTHAAALGLLSPPPPNLSEEVHEFAQGAIEDALKRHGAQAQMNMTTDWAGAIIAAAQQAGVAHVVTPFAPVGPVATKLASVQDELAQAGIELHQQQRAYDAATWPHATKGFFKLKKMIPNILAELGLSGGQSA